MVTSKQKGGGGDVAFIPVKLPEEARLDGYWLKADGRPRASVHLNVASDAEIHNVSYFCTPHHKSAAGVMLFGDAVEVRNARGIIYVDLLSPSYPVFATGAAAPEPAEAPVRRGLPASHPGALLRNTVLPDLKKKGVAKVQFAAGIGVSRQTLEDLVQERQGVSPEMALRLGKYLRGDPEFWLNLQRRWDLDRARAKIGDQLEAIEPLPEDVISG